MRPIRSTIFCLMKLSSMNAFWFLSSKLKVKAVGGNHDIRHVRHVRDIIHENINVKMTKLTFTQKNQWFLPFGVVLDENPAYLRVHEGRCRHLLICSHLTYSNNTDGP